MAPTERPTPAPVDFDNIPVQLRGLCQFFVWSYKWVEDKEKNLPGKWDKPPINARTGDNASTTDPETWRTLEEAKTAYESSDYDGIGVALSPGDPYFGMDLDHCIINGELTSMGRSIFNRTRSRMYWEISPSGKGLRGIGIGTIPPGPRKNSISGFEIYSENRYLTLTGHVIEGCDQISGNATAIAAEIHAEQFPSKLEAATTTSHRRFGCRRYGNPRTL